MTDMREGEPQSIVETAGLSDLPEIGRLRSSAWRASVPHCAHLAPAIDTDEHDYHAEHWVIRVEGRIVAAARLCHHNSIAEIPDGAYFAECGSRRFLGPVGSLNRLVVDSRFRRHGYARSLDIKRIESARESLCGCAVVSTGAFRVPRLEALGFKVIGAAPPAAVLPWKDQSAPCFLLVLTLE